MKKIAFTFLIVLIGILVFLPNQVLAYQETEVKNGGTIRGKAILTGKIPEPRIFHLVLFPNLELCAKVDTDENMNRLLNDFQVSSDGALKDVVISLQHVEVGKPFLKEPVNILSKDCKFTPGVTVVRQDEKFKVDNVDSVMHNSQVYQSERGKIILNIPIPAEEVSDGKIHFQKNYTQFQMVCGMHEFMQTWGYRVQNPYYFISGDDGTYQLDNIPPGDYVVNAWHNSIKIRTKKVHVEENSVIDLNFEFDGNEVTRPHYESIASGRIKEEAFKSRDKVLKGK
jgi:hypothetical protein